MKHVILPKRMMSDLNIQREVGGRWEKGKWIEGDKGDQKIKGICMPFTSSELKNLPEGFATIDDKDLKTYSELEEGEEILLDGKAYTVRKGLDYGELTDMKNYILKGIEK